MHPAFIHPFFSICAGIEMLFHEVPSLRQVLLDENAVLIL